MSNKTESFEEIKASLEAQLVWMSPLAAGTPTHSKGWQIIEDQWEKLLNFCPRTELMRMQLATMKKALEAAECGSIMTKEQMINYFLKTNIGRLAWKDFKEGSPGKRVAITGKGKEEVSKKHKEQEGRERKKQTEFTFDVVLAPSRTRTKLTRTRSKK